MITCGADGDVRIWLDLMDDDPVDACIGEQNTACLSKNGKIFVANDKNTVQILSYPDCEKEGIVTRFSSTVSALSTTANSNLIVSGACDMRIQVSNIDTSDSIELNGHEAPILGLSLDPKEEFVASSSADGTIKVWDIKEKKSIHTWSNVVPKCNSFETAKSFCTPAFNSNGGSFLAYPHGKEIILVERNTWKELSRLKCSLLKSDLNICKSSPCGSRLAACSIHGEIVVWGVNNGEVIGHVEATTSKITALVWHLKRSTELAFCDSKGQFGCVSITAVELDDLIINSIGDTNDIDSNMLYNGNDDDDDGDNVISLNKIKNSQNIDDDARSHVSSISSIPRQAHFLPPIKQQEAFQPGSTPIHLLSRFMLWNEVGIVKCYANEDDDNSSIEVEFHDTSIHHGMHINNYLKHNIASLSSEALALSCQSCDGNPSKLVVIALHGWGSSNKEWSIDLPEDEESVCVAAGNNFVALATSRRNLRLFMISGIQREVLALPGPVVAMNALGNHLVVAYHTGVGAAKDQQMNCMWIQIRGPDLKSRTVSLPLSPATELMWLGLSDVGSPVIMDSEGVLRIFSRKSGLWRVAADTDKQCKGKMDHYFIIGVAEKERCTRCILCKGSHYPATTPRPNVVEIPLNVPLCDIESERTRKEAPLWQIGSHPSEQSTALFTLIGYACSANIEHTVVDLCQNIAPQNIIELAIKYASKSGKMALAKKLQNIAEEKNRKANDDFEEEEDIFAGMEDESGNQNEEIILTPITKQKSEFIEIRPLTASLKKRNPFLKKNNSPSTKGLGGLNSIPDKPEKPQTPLATLKPKIKSIETKKETFVGWYLKNKSDLAAEFPELSAAELTKVALTRFKEDPDDSQTSADGEAKKRKLSSPEPADSQTKRPANSLLQFLSDK